MKLRRSNDGISLNLVVPDEKLESEVMVFAERLARGATLAFATSRRITLLDKASLTASARSSRQDRGKLRVDTFPKPVDFLNVFQESRGSRHPPAELSLIEYVPDSALTAMIATCSWEDELRPYAGPYTR